MLPASAGRFEISRDNLPVHSLFLLLATNIRNHLTLLAEIGLGGSIISKVREAVKDHAGQTQFLRAIDRLSEHNLWRASTP